MDQVRIMSGARFPQPLLRQIGVSMTQKRPLVRFSALGRRRGNKPGKRIQRASLIQMAETWSNRGTTRGYRHLTPVMTKASPTTEAAKVRKARIEMRIRKSFRPMQPPVPDFELGHINPELSCCILSHFTGEHLAPLGSLRQKNASVNSVGQNGVANIWDHEKDD
jgi:hypothetical protein